MGTVLSDMGTNHFILVVAALASLFLSVVSDCEVAEKCDQTACEALGAEHCHCSGNETNIPIADRPMIIYLTFDDAFTAIAEKEFYSNLFDGSYTNPNDCAIRATHFITQSYTDYSLVNRYWHLGHEMAAHSISHRNDLKYWQNLDVEGWKDEMVGIRKMIGQFASIDPCQVTGSRAPFLQGGGDNMFQMLAENNFMYDCSWPTRSYGYMDAESGLFPYTLDYESIQDCPIQPCPTCGNLCSMLDGCVIMGEQTKEHVYDMLMKNFQRVYNGSLDDFGTFQPGNKAPWGLYMHAAWFFGDYSWHYEGYKMFIEEITNADKYPDVFIVPIEAGLEYMKKPLPMQVLQNWGKQDNSPFGCEAIEAQSGKYANFRCGGGQSCRFNVTEPADNIGPGSERYMTICKYKSDQSRQNCPQETQYPWLDEKDHCGGNSPCADCV